MSPKILLIDDSENITSLLSRLLNKYGYEATIADTGSDGVRLAREQRPEAVILDMMMPELDGWQVCKEIRRFSNVPIIVYTGLSDLDTKKSILAAGANCFLVKPMPINELVAAVRDTIRQANRRGPTGGGQMDIFTQPL